MSYRFMRMIVFFDLPVETAEDRRNYTHFRKLLIKNGFIMLQESVYAKLITTPSVEQSINGILEKSRPPAGIVQSILITEKQFSKMYFIVGESNSEYIDNMERLLVL